MKSKIQSDRIPCECMDLVEIAHRDRIYPVMYCRMVIRGHLDAERLKEAVKMSAQVIPEILYTVDFKRGRFVDRHLTAEQVICREHDAFSVQAEWDLSVDTQLKISILPEEDVEQLVIGMSHVLADGKGFLQYLYLLSAIYNGERPKRDLRNTRDIRIVMQRAPRLSMRETYTSKCFRMQGDAPVTRLLHKAVCSRAVGSEKYCICCSIEKQLLEQMHLKAHALHVSINDVLMTAYSRVILRRWGERTVTLPCPADLRNRNPDTEELTVGNMTGLYRTVPVSMEQGDPFERTLCQVHEEMARQKEAGLCLQGIPLLRLIHNRLPTVWIIRMIHGKHKIYTTSYTNIGIIDGDRLHFADCNIESCYLTGAYRKAPDFQLSVSTFNGICTLNCTLIGTIQRKIEGEKLLKEIKTELLDWIE